MTVTRVEIFFVEQDLTVRDLETSTWQRSAPALLDKLWNGEPAPAGRRAAVPILWSDEALHVRFDAQQAEPLVVFDDADSTVKRIGLWERDVCELFIAPDARNRRRYFEFEIAPSGEWLDLIVDWTKDEPRRWDYTSGMETFAKIEPDRVTMAMKIPWTAFGRKPEAGDVWLGNLFRQVGSGETRGYLAWSPTMTKEPNFHVPERFGEFVFRD